MPVWNEYQTLLDAEQDLSVFKTWPIVNKIPLYHFDEGWVPYCADNELMLSKYTKSEQKLWMSLLKEPETGHTFESYEKAKRDFHGYECSAWTMKTLNHLLTFEKVTQRNLNRYTQFVDFGAGIGETTRILSQLYPSKFFAICDLPSTMRISKYYCSQAWSPISYTFEDDITKIPNNRKTLVIGTWSISETDLDTREKVFSHFRGHDFLMAVQPRFEDINNARYFAKTFQNIAKVEIKFANMAPLWQCQDQPFYVFGLGLEYEMGL